MSEKEVNSENGNQKLLPFLRLNKDKYSLDLTLDGALGIGISKSDYEIAVNSIQETNDFISKARKEANHELILTDPATVGKDDFLKAMPSGTLSPNGQEQVGDTFFAPNGTLRVKFTCRGGGAPTPVLTCRAKALGGWHQKSVTGVFTTYKTLYIDLDASNMNVSITFQTSDSNGGSCDWIGEM